MLANVIWFLFKNLLFNFFKSLSFYYISLISINSSAYSKSIRYGLSYFPFYFLKIKLKGLISVWMMLKECTKINLIL
jgi:hypothetical protein